MSGFSYYTLSNARLFYKGRVLGLKGLTRHMQEDSLINPLSANALPLMSKIVWN